MVEAVKIISKLYDDYVKTTPNHLKLVDAYLFYIVLTGIPQFLYCLLVGTFPFNAFLSGFASTIASFVLGAALRIQVDPRNRKEFESISIERSFADFIFGHLVLHLVVFNFLG